MTLVTSPRTSTPFPSLSPEAIAAALGQFPPTPEQSAVIAAPLAPTLVVAGREDAPLAAGLGGFGDTHTQLVRADPTVTRQGQSFLKIGG